MSNLWVTSLFATHSIEFDAKQFECGAIQEGKVDRLHAVFTVTNTGDELLKLLEVRPGCGCTVVDFDSTVAPGKSSKIEASVNIKGYHAGPISKGITVTSNAPNDSVARLVINAEIVPPGVELSADHIVFTAQDTGTARTVTLTSAKKNLKVTAVVFRTANAVHPVRYSFRKTDSVRPVDGLAIYKLEIIRLKADTLKSGDLVVSTNHPEARELIIHATVTP